MNVTTEENDELTEEERRVLDRARRKEGARGGRKRWAGTTKEERSAHARMMLEARWGKQDNEEEK